MSSSYIKAAAADALHYAAACFALSLLGYLIGYGLVVGLYEFSVFLQSLHPITNYLG